MKLKRFSDTAYEYRMSAYIKQEGLYSIFKWFSHTITIKRNSYKETCMSDNKYHNYKMSDIYHYQHEYSYNDYEKISDYII